MAIKALCLFLLLIPFRSSPDLIFLPPSSTLQNFALSSDPPFFNEPAAPTTPLPLVSSRSDFFLADWSSDPEFFNEPLLQDAVDEPSTCVEATGGWSDDDGETEARVDDGVDVGDEIVGELSKSYGGVYRLKRVEIEIHRDSTHVQILLQRKRIARRLLGAHVL